MFEWSYTSFVHVLFNVSCEYFTFWEIILFAARRKDQYCCHVALLVTKLEALSVSNAQITKLSVL